jgi:ABC-2 type transport system ATP-binding protein
MATVVSTDRLTKDFKTGFWRPRAHRGLDELTLQIPAGGVFGLLGPNGAGKSTTLKLLLNLLTPTSGRAELFGLPPGDLNARRRLGFLPENPSFYEYLTAEELLTYFSGLCGQNPDDARRRSSSLLDLVGLGADRRRPMRQFSKGMIQRVGIAQSLINDPELVILDEPMSGLDPLGRREVRELILKLRDQGRTVVFSSHVLSDAELLCSSVGILARGRLLASGALSELTARGKRGCEVVASGVHDELASRLAARGLRATRIGDGRYSFELDGNQPPEPLIAELAAAGASLVSVLPLKTTLEEAFVELVRSGSEAAVRS